MSIDSKLTLILPHGFGYVLNNMGDKMQFCALHPHKLEADFSQYDHQIAFKKLGAIIQGSLLLSLNDPKCYCGQQYPRPSSGLKILTVLHFFCLFSWHLNESILPNELHLRVLKEQLQMIIEPFLVTFKNFW